MASKMCSSLLLVGMTAMIAVNIRPSLGEVKVTMNISYEGLNSYLINVIFTLDLFTEFYKCLCKKQSGSCIAKYSTQTYQVYTISSRQSQEQDGPTCRLFRCKNSGSYVNVTCTKLDQQQPSCANPSFISLPKAPSCDFTCVGMDWTFTEERLLINGSQVEDQHCKNQCCSTTITPLPISTPLPGNNQSKNASNDTQPSYKETIIISGVTAGLVFVAVVVVIIILLVKGKQRPVSTPRGNNLAPVGGTNAHKAERNKTSRQNNGFSQNTNSNQGQLKWAAGFIGALRGQRNRGQGGNAHNTGPNSATSEVNANWQLEEMNLKTEESEYAVIDEAQVQPGGSYDSISNGNTHTSFGDYANDGYTSLDQFDYDNIKDTASPRNYTNEKDYQNNLNLAQSNFLEIQPSSSSSISGEIPEYSMAKRIADDTDNATKVGLVGSTETPAHASDREEGTRQPPARPTLDQLAVNESLDIGDGSKRNPYFKLIKEEEEEEKEEEDSIERDSESERKSYF